MPDKYPQAIKLLQDNFPSIDIEAFRDEGQEYDDHEEQTKTPYIDVQFKADDDDIDFVSSSSPSVGGTIILENSMERIKGKIKKQDNNALHIPLNSVLWSCATKGRQSLLANLITNPRDFLSITQKILYEEVKETRISPNASVAKSCIIEGPCIIEEDCTIDDFSKIKGPAYIGKDSFIGMGSLVRNCMLENNTRIDFNCEVGESYFAGHAKISHLNVILDSIIGENAWFGGFSGTANVLLDRRNVKDQIGNKFVDTGTDHFGAVVGNNCAIGASVIILPGRQIQPNSTIQAGTIVGKLVTER